MSRRLEFEGKACQVDIGPGRTCGATATHRVRVWLTVGKYAHFDTCGAHADRYLRGDAPSGTDLQGMRK
jgi:hypothetical protein